jgi:2-hydroxymuconate-semialdehyde hydrolase
MGSITSRDVKVGAVSFHLNHSGDPRNEAVLWLHGSGPGATGMSNWEAIIEQLAGDFYNLAPDIIGFGDSTHPDPPPQGIAAFTKLRVDTILGLLDTLDLRKVNLVGNSMGGLISLCLVQKAPERISRVILMGSGGGPVTPSPELLKLVTFYNNPTTDSMAELLSCFVYDPAFWGDKLKDIAAQRIPRATRDDVRRSHLATFAPGQPPVLFSDEELAQIKHPVMVVHGREDRIIPVASSYHLAKHIPNAELHIFPKTGHWLQIEQSQRFANLARAFIKGEI